VVAPLVEGLEGHKLKLLAMKSLIGRAVSFDPPCQKMQAIVDGLLRLGKLGLARASATIYSCVVSAASMIVLPWRITSSPLLGSSDRDEVRSRRHSLVFI
jgi:hypothetical protein